MAVTQLRSDTRTSDLSSLKIKKKNEDSRAGWTASVWGDSTFLLKFFCTFKFFLKSTLTIRFGGCFSKAINNRF